jgi:cytochrome b561
MTALCATIRRPLDPNQARDVNTDVARASNDQAISTDDVAMPAPATYGAIARLLHWTMFALIAVQVVGGLAIEWFPRASDGRVFMLSTHTTLGIVAFLLVLARIARRLAERGLPPEGPLWQRRLASAAHGPLYALMVAVPLVGYLLADARGRGIPFFGLDMPEWIATDRNLAHTLEDVHSTLAWVLVGVVALHAAAALWHHFVLKDDTLRRMLPSRP